VQFFAVASCMDEGRGLGRVPKCFEDFEEQMQNNHIEMISIHFW
jgi:hypothetical protein